jgi:hypothetical protein
MLILFLYKNLTIEEDCNEGSKIYFHLGDGILHSDILFELLQVMDILLPKLA